VADSSSASIATGAWRALASLTVHDRPCGLYYCDRCQVRPSTTIKDAWVLSLAVNDEVLHHVIYQRGHGRAFYIFEMA